MQLGDRSALALLLWLSESFRGWSVQTGKRSAFSVRGDVGVLGVLGVPEKCRWHQPFCVSNEVTPPRFVRSSGVVDRSGTGKEFFPFTVPVLLWYTKFFSRDRSGGVRNIVEFESAD